MVTDDDCTTMAKIKETVDHPVKKWSDLNHTRKNIGNKLYNLQKKTQNIDNNCYTIPAKVF